MFVLRILSGTRTKLMFSADKILKVLGEGGFSFVYLAQDETSGVGAISASGVTGTTDCGNSVSSL